MGKANYIYKQGNPQNGTVVLLPQRHGVDHASAASLNHGLSESILASQFEVFTALRECSAKHVFIEGFDPEFAQAFNLTWAQSGQTPRFADRLWIAHLIAKKFMANQAKADGTWHPANGSLSQALNEEEQNLLMKVGGAGCIGSSIKKVLSR